MTAIVKKCLLAALVATGLVASSGSASAGFQLTFTFLSSGPQPSNGPPPNGGVQNFTVFNSNLAPGNVGGVIDLWDGNLDVGPNLRLTYTASLDAVSDMLRINSAEVTWSHANVVALDPIKFRLEASYDAVNVPGAPGDGVLFSVNGSVVGGNQSFLQNAKAEFEQPPSNNVATILAFPNIPLQANPPIPLPGGPVPFINNGGLGKVMYTAEFQLAGYQNAVISLNANLENYVVPAPAGLILAGLGLPALGLASRFRRKAAVKA